jgi:hypothetical protein
MTAGDKPDPRPPAVEDPTVTDQVHGSANAATPRAKSVQTGASAQEVLHRWGHVVEPSSWRPHVVPTDPAAPGECLCGDPADFVVETNWFGGRHSQDLVCGRHVDEVVRAIRKQQARRNGA